MKLSLPFQAKGVDFLSKGGVLLGDDPGLGKTYQALLALEQFETRHPVLVVCPSVAVGAWLYEFLEREPACRVLILTSANYKKLAQEWDMVIVSVDLPARNDIVFNALQQLTYDLMILDEGHYCANPDAARARRTLLDPRALAKRASRVMIMTGTPMSKHPGELWPLVYATAPERIRRQDYPAFINRYCRFKMMQMPNGRQVRVPSGSNAVANTELAQLLGMGEVPWWLRRRKRVVMPELPERFPERNIVMTIGDLDGQEYQEFMKTAEGKELMAVIRSGRFEMLRASNRKLNLARLRRLLGIAKAPFAREYIKGAFEQGHEAVVAWALHTEVLDTIARGFDNDDVVRIDGSTPLLQRPLLERKFQDPKGPRLFLGQIAAAGVALTLTRASYSIFVEKSWSWVKNSQASDRTDRIGQSKGLLYDRLTVAESVDEAVIAVTDRREGEWERLDPGANEED